MPLYVYQARKTEKSCEYCRQGFEILQGIKESPLSYCPRCHAAVKRVFAPVSQGESKTAFDRRAKEKGFHKLKRVDKGTYEKLY